jgi:YD repeat-containing protein
MFDRPRHRRLTAIILFLYVLLAGSLLAQTSPVTGIPPLSSATTGSFDTVDSANLNVHFSIPVFARAGKGIPFSYSLSYDSLVWNIATNSLGQLQWSPQPTWGWRGVTEASTGYVTYTYTDGVQVCSNNNVEKETWTNWVYHDASAVPHPFPGTIIIYDDNGCGSGRSFSTATASDNSGYVLHLPVVTSGEQIVPTTVYGPSGIKYTPPSQSQTGGASVTDPNGNSIVTAVNGSTTTITDTLGTTALTINGFAPNNPLSCSPNVTYQYTAPNGQLATITASYVGYIIQTNFNVPGILEYGPTNACLLQTITMPDGSTYGFAYEGTAGHSGELTGRLLSVTLPTGGSISWSYTNSGCYNASNCMMADGSPAWMVRTYGGNSWNYQRYVRSTQGWCGNSSFQTDTTIVDPDGNYTDNYFSGLYPTAISVYVGARTQFLDTKNYCYNGNLTTCQCALVASTETTPIASRVVYDYPNNGTLYSETDYSYDSYGNLIGETDKDFGSGSNVTLRKTTIVNSATSGASNQSLCTNYNICNSPASIQITNGSTQAAYTTYSYDQGGNTHGSVTTVSRWTSGSNYLNQGYSYNSNGTVATATDPNGTQTTYSYAGTSCNSAFPTSVTVVGQTTQYGYNCTGSVVTSVTDPNNATASTSYNDPYFWRPASTKDPLSNFTYYNYYRVNNSGGSEVSSVSQTESVMTFNSGNSVQETLTTMDSWGRPQLTQKRQSPSSSDFDTVQLMYDENSRVQYALRPFVTNAGQASGGGLPATGYTYDTLGRVTQVVDWANLTVTYGYKLNDTEVTVSGQPSGENPKSRQFEYDGLGRLSSVCELTAASGSGCGQNNNPGTNGYKTTYTYDPLGNQVGVNQSGQTRSYAYDGLSRMTSETNPESGTKTYQYDQVGPVACNGSGWTSKGDLLVTADARGAVTCNYYDALHRVTDIGNNSQSASNPCQRFRYDNSKGYKGSIPTGITLSNYWGRMVEAATDICGGTGDPVLSDEWFSYDSRGQATDYWQSSTNSGGWYHVTQSYAANGNRLGLQGFLNNGSAFTQNLLYDNNEGEGRPRGLAFGSSSVWCCTAYNAAGQPNQVQMVGGSTGSFETFSYDGNSGRMTQWESYNSGVSKSQTGTLTWNGNGSLQKLVVNDSYDTGNAQTCTYGYDDLARLLSANCSPAWSQTFSYDVFGNLTKTGNVNYNPGYNSNNRALTSTYDSAGDTLNDGSNTYTYDAKGRPITVGSVQILYDAFGRTVEYNTSGTYTQWLYDPQGGKLAGMTG